MLKVPHDVTLKGAGEGKTMLMWQYQDVNSAVPALLRAADDLALAALEGDADNLLHLPST